MLITLCVPYHCPCRCVGVGAWGGGGVYILSVTVSLIRRPVWPSGKALGW